MMRGFTLLEILITLIFLATGIIALCWAFNAGVSFSSNIESIETALNIAGANMEAIKGKGFNEIITDGDSGPAADPNFPNFDVTVNIAEDDDPMQIDVTVGWGVASHRDSITLTTLVANY